MGNHMGWLVFSAVSGLANVLDVDWRKRLLLLGPMQTVRKKTAKAKYEDVPELTWWL